MLRHVGYCGISFCLDEFGQALVVVGVVGAHDAVPDVEIDAVVSIGLFVVHDVVGGGVEQVAQPAFHHPAGVKFKSCMPQDVVENLPPHEYAESQRMNGDQKCGQGKNGRLCHRFPKTEGIGRPGCGVIGLVMHLVNPVEKFWVMHPSVGPIKISVMEQDSQKDAQGKPTRTSLRHAPIDSRVSHPGQGDGHHADGSKDQDRKCGVEEFPSDILPAGVSLDDFAVEPSRVKEPVTQGPGNEGQYKVSDANHYGDSSKDFQ